MCYIRYLTVGSFKQFNTFSTTANVMEIRQQGAYIIQIQQSLEQLWKCRAIKAKRVNLSILPFSLFF